MRRREGLSTFNVEGCGVAGESDYYRVLEVRRDASEKEIKRAYHRLARERHPDKGTTPEEVKRLQEEFALISTAYNVLKDKDKRAEYDTRCKKDEAKAAGSGREGKGAPAAEDKASMKPGAKGAAASRERASIAQRAYAKGMQLFNAGDYARAKEFFEAAIKNNDEEPNYHAKLGICLMRSHQGFSRAVSAIQKAIELDPYNVEHRLTLGETYEKVGSTSMAVKTYQEILKWDATNAKAQERLHALGAGRGTLLNRLFRRFKK